MANIWVGITNGQMPGNKSSFPQEFQAKSRLHYYATLFTSIEINSTFYKIPQLKTLAKWSTDVPEGFRFTLKLNRDITHAPHLEYDPDRVKQFMNVANGIGNSKGCLLIQFPGKITVEYFSQLETLLGDLNEEKHGWHIAVEFRHESWYIRETSELSNEFNAAMVIHDFSRAPMGTISDNASFCYLRFHGPEGNYRESYTDEFLEGKAKFIRELSQEGRDIFVYFNNTAGNAYGNALYMKTLLSN